MASRKWTVVIVPEDDSELRQYRLSDRSVRVGVGTIVAVFLVLAALAAGFFVQENTRREAVRLAEANRLLEREIDNIRGQLTTLESELGELVEKDTRYRLLAGLSPIDDEVRQVGIGGPGTETPQANDLWALDRAAGEMAFSTAADLNTLIRRARLLETSWDEATRTIEADRDRFQATPSILPTGGFISSGFSKRRLHPILHVPRPHRGIDVAADHGTRVASAANGRVTFVGYRGDYGLMVEIDHGYGYVTRYAHLATATVKRGEAVERGEKIGEVGETGLVTNPSLHYEVRVDGRAQDPRDYILGEVLPF